MNYERFSHSGVLLQALSYPISLRKDTHPVIRTQIDPEEKNTFYSRIGFENEDKDKGDMLLKTSFTEEK